MDYSDHNPVEPHGRDEMEMKFSIHCMETEAYGSVLRAFIAQSDLLSWGKMALITEMRRELNVTDLEHEELLMKINSDESIKKIREWQKGARYAQESGKVNAPGLAPNSVGNAPEKKLKTSCSAVSKAQKYVSHGQTSTATIPYATPGKMGPITELRKELNVADLEHEEPLPLMKINSDESIKKKRAWQKGARYAQESGKVNAPGFAPNSVGNAPEKKLKTSYSAVAKAQKYVSHGQTSTATISSATPGKMGPITELRKELNVTDLEHEKLLMKINSDESNKRKREWQKGARYAQESGKVNPPGFATNSVGNAPEKKLKTSYSAVAKAQKYVSHGQTSTTPIPSASPAQFRDDQGTGELVNAGQSIKKVGHNIQAPSISRGRGSVKSQGKKSFQEPYFGSLKKRSDLIVIPATDKLIKEVEGVIYGRENPDPDQVEKAKIILREQETAILEALSKVADLLDGGEDYSPDQMWHHHGREELPGIGQEPVACNDFYGQTHSVKVRIPCIDVRNEEAP